MSCFSYILQNNKHAAAEIHCNGSRTGYNLRAQPPLAPSCSLHVNVVPPASHLIPSPVHIFIYTTNRSIHEFDTCTWWPHANLPVISERHLISHIYEMHQHILKRKPLLRKQSHDHFLWQVINVLFTMHQDLIIFLLRFVVVIRTWIQNCVHVECVLHCRLVCWVDDNDGIPKYGEHAWYNKHSPTCFKCIKH